MALILVDLKDYIGTLTFNHDDKRNALGSALIEELINGLHDLERRRARVVVLRANPGAKVWSAGVDVSEFPQPGRDPISYAAPLEQAIRAIQRCPAPVIALITAGVWGGAVELAFVCDLLIGTPKAAFTITPARLGVPYNPSGILHLMNMAGMAVIKEMFFTAQPLSAERAEKYGILNHVTPPEEIDDFTYNLARQIARNSPLSIAVIKEQLRLLGNATPLTTEAFERIQTLRRTVYDSQDYIEGQRAFLEKRDPVYRGE